MTIEAETDHRPQRASPRGTFDELARVWDNGGQQTIAETSVAAYQALIERLPVTRPGESWVDVATGTGPLAIRAARAGAVVNAFDIAPGLLETGRRLAAAEDLPILFEERRAERHGFVPDSFDAVVSAFGSMYTVDHPLAAAQMATIVRPEGRIAIASWTPESWVAEAYALAADTPSLRGFWSGPDPFAWGTAPFIDELFGDAFRLEFAQLDVPLTASSGEAVWRLFGDHDGPTRTMVERLDDNSRERYRAAFVELAERYRDGDVVRLPRPYLLAIGHRR